MSGWIKLVATVVATAIVVAGSGGVAFGATVYGTHRIDDLYGTAFDEFIHALSGDDRVSGLGGSDRIHGSEGHDVLYGDGGDPDSVYWQRRPAGPAGADTIYGEWGNDTLHGGGGNDDLRGNWDNDDLRGDEGNDHLEGGPGTDRLNGGPGDDTIYAEDDGGQADLIDCGPGSNDTVYVDLNDQFVNRTPALSGCEKTPNIF